MFNLADRNLNNQVFYCTGSGATSSWQVWNKPLNCNYVNIMLIGGGAGGKGGATGNANTRSGGAGGGSAAISYYTYPAFAIPDILYVQVGQGGTGGAGTGSGLQGSQGTLSFVSIFPDSTLTSTNIIARSGSANAGISTSITAGVAIAGIDILAQFALVSSYNGQAGGAGGTSATKAPDLLPSNIPIMGGAGGAGCNSVGVPGTSAHIGPFLFVPTISGGTSIVGGVAGDGNHGFSTRENFNNINFEFPLFCTGGAGGGSSTRNPDSNICFGGNGGNGSFGSGGGGGGAGFTAQGGDGGRGGDGLVIITVS